MASLTCTITKAGRSDAYGRPLLQGQTYTSGFDEIKSLVQAGFASVSNPVVLDDGFFEVKGSSSRFLNKTLVSTIDQSTGAAKGVIGADGKEKELSKPLTKMLARKRASILNYGHLTPLTNSGSGYTYSIAQAMPGPFVGVRFLVGNIATGGTVTYGPFSASVTNQVTSAAEARNNNATQVPVLFGGQPTVTVDVASAADVPVLYWSDLAPINSANPTALNKYWICGRGYATTANTQQLCTSANRGAGWNNHPSGLQFWSCGSGAGDFVTSNVTGFAGGLNTGQNIILGVEVVLADGTSVFQVNAYGDSLFAGAGASVDLLGDSFLFQASVDTSLVYPSVVANYGWPGKTTAHALQRFLAEVDLTSPSACVFYGYSTNDGSPTKALLEAAFVRVNTFIDTCHVRGIVPIVVTPLLSDLWTTAEKNLLKPYRQRIRELEGRAVIMDIARYCLTADELAIVAGGTSDSVHLNSAVGIPLARINATEAFKQALQF